MNVRGKDMRKHLNFKQARLLRGDVMQACIRDLSFYFRLTFDGTKLRAFTKAGSELKTRANAVYIKHQWYGLDQISLITDLSGHDQPLKTNSHFVESNRLLLLESVGY